MSSAFRSVTHSRRPSSTRRSPLYPVPAPQRPKQQRPKQQRPKQQRLNNSPSKLSQRPLRSVPKGAEPSLRAVSTPTHGVATVKRFPAKRAMPLWLRLLIQAQRGSLVIAFLLVTATLLVYGSTVYTQQLWSKEYRKLKTDLRNEQEMIATNEGLKNQLARQAERPASGLVPQTPESTIFLQPALQRQAPMASPSVPKAEAAPNTPLGY